MKNVYGTIKELAGPHKITLLCKTIIKKNSKGFWTDSFAN